MFLWFCICYLINLIEWKISSEELICLKARSYNGRDGKFVKQEQRIKELFELAVQRQTKEMNDNITGYGIDNHLMGLRYAASEAGEPIPEVLNDEAYKIVNHFALSTSQV